MENKDFVHLHTHDTFSYLDGFGLAEQYARRAKELGFKYLALTNHGNIDGLIKFQRACLNEKIIPLFGCELYIVSDLSKKEKGEKRGHITILIKNRIGWKNLCKMLTIANLEGFYYKPRIDKELLLKSCKGLIVLSGCFTSLNIENRNDFYFKLFDILGDDFYYEVMPHNFKGQIEVNQKFSSFFNLIATNDIHYILKEDAKVQEVLLAIQIKAKWKDKDRFKFSIEGLHLRTADEMIEAFQVQNILSESIYRIAIKNTKEVAEKCDFRIEKHKIYLPDCLEIDLFEICKKNLLRKFSYEMEEYGEYIDRLVGEYKIIERKGFLDYFRVVYDLVLWCKKNDILIGPCRGSVGGSLFAYLLGITQIDPVKNELLFFRFISEARNDYPDIDIDFEDSKRELVKEYLKKKYGEGKVFGISTFLKMKGRTVVRDVSRVFDIPLKEVNEFVKLIYGDEGEEGSLDEIIHSKEGKFFLRKYPEVIEISIKLENQIKGLGRHAAGIAIGKNDLKAGFTGNLCNRKGEIVVNWDMEDCEYMGLIKLDALVLKNLSVLSEVKKSIRDNYDKNINFEEINLKDKKVLEQFFKGNTVGVFQFNTYGVTKLCKEINIKDFEDLVHINALYRPGPLRSGMIDKYKRNRYKKKLNYFCKDFEEIVKSTYGIIIFQEQVMMIVNRIAGLSWSDADRMRKIIGKSKGQKELRKFKEKFIDGCIRSSKIVNKTAYEIWREIETFGGYGFNRSHSFGYSMLAFWDMWLKVYYPLEFFCASLIYSSEDQKVKLIQEINRIGIRIEPPKLRISKGEKWVIKEDKLYCPFIEIKGVGDVLAKKIEDLSFSKKQRVGFFSNINLIDYGSLLKVSKIVMNVENRDYGWENNFKIKFLKKE